MNESQEKHSRQMDEASAYHFSFSIDHLSFFISHPSFFRHHSAFILS